MRCRPRQFIFLVLLIGLVLMRESRIAPLEPVESRFQGWLGLNTQRPAAGPPAPLTLVQITDDDLTRTPWPWSPLDFSLFLNAALPFNPAVVGVEPVLSWSKPNAQQLTVLHNQLLRSPKVLLGAEMGFQDDPSVIPSWQEVPVLRHVEGSISTVQEFTLVAKQPSEDLRMAGTLGFENIGVGADSKLFEATSRVPLVFRYRGQVVPSFVLQAAMLWYGVTPEEVTVAPGSHIALGKAVRIPVDSEGAMLVDFSIPLTRYSMSDLLLSAEQIQAKQPPVAPVGKLAGSMALLSRTDQDARTVLFANGEKGSVGMLFASAIATIQTQSFIKPAPIQVELGVILGFILLAWGISGVGKLASTGACCLVFAVYMLVTLGVFATTAIALPFVLTVGLFAFVLAFRILD